MFVSRAKGTQCAKRRRITPAIANRPVPTSTSDCGSETSTGLEQLPAKMQTAAVREVLVFRRSAKAVLAAAKSTTAFFLTGTSL